MVTPLVGVSDLSFPPGGITLAESVHAVTMPLARPTAAEPHGSPTYTTISPCTLLLCFVCVPLGHSADKMALVLQMSQSPCVTPPELKFSCGYIQSASNFVTSWINTFPVIIPTEGLDLTQSPPPFFREGLSNPCTPRFCQWAMLYYYLCQEYDHSRHCLYYLVTRN